MFTEYNCLIFSGNYGSGKTEIALNVAMLLAKNEKVNLVDLDIINPYFRSRDIHRRLAQGNVQLIIPDSKVAYSDSPSIPAQAVGSIKSNVRTILDVGGDPTGAMVLGSMAETIQVSNHGHFFVVNVYRPYTATTDAILALKTQIEKAAKVSFTHIINNSNLGFETSAEDVLRSREIIKEVCDKSGLQLYTTMVNKGLHEELNAKIKNLFVIERLLPLEWQN